MLSGSRAFHGDSGVETMNAILKEDPPDLSSRLAAIPPALNRLVRRCLEKNPDERFRSAHDVAFALEALSESSVSVPPVAVPETNHGNRAPLIVAAAAIVLITAAFIAGRFSVPGVAYSDEGATSFKRLTFQHGTIVRFVFGGRPEIGKGPS